MSLSIEDKNDTNDETPKFLYISKNVNDDDLIDNVPGNFLIERKQSFNSVEIYEAVSC